VKAKGEGRLGGWTGLNRGSVGEQRFGSEARGERPGMDASLRSEVRGKGPGMDPSLRSEESRDGCFTPISRHLPICQQSGFGTASSLQQTSTLVKA
jgi:hypothetical protein